MNSVKEIVEWAVTDLSDWEADLVRRLLENGTLTEDSTKQVIDNVIAAFEIEEAGEQKNCTAPFFQSETADDQPLSDPIKLCSVHSVENVNAIYNGSTLPFSHSGITLIYGENGSGKSGYTRLLKNACFAKHVEPEILPNIYKPQKGSQCAKISFIKNGERFVWEWSPGSTLTDLSDINVYDSDSGKVLLEKNNQVTYKPKGVEIFDEVAAITEEIKTIVSGKLKTAKLPDIPEIESFPLVHGWLKAISEKTTIQSIKNTISWNDEKQTELNALGIAIQENENGTSAKKLEKIIALIDTRIPRVMSKLKGYLLILSSQKAKEVSDLQNAASISKQAYDLAISKSDIFEPLEGIHTEAWKLLFNAAKEFSEHHAYTGKSFPNTDHDSLCVLCMQPLEHEAKERLSRFDSYISDKSKAVYEKALENISIAKKAINDLIVPDQESYEPLCADLTDILGSDYKIDEIFKIIKSRKEYFELQNNESLTYHSGLIDIDPLSQKLTEALKQKNQEIQQTIAPDKHKKNVARHSELQLAHNLYKSQDLIIAYQQSLAFNKKVSNALSSIRSTKQKFSTKAKSIISQLVTPDFIENFKTELVFMGVSLDVKISPVVRDSDTSHSFSIATKRPSKILSEGEQKVISLSAFLAEIKTFKNTAPIILDDPVSSLDHVYRERIAQRLAKEALTRQVIIFTHDLSLIMEIEGKCDDIALSLGKGPARSTFTIRRNGTDSDFCFNKAPWRGMSTAQRAQQLEEDIHSFKNLHETDIESYNQRTALLYCLLREAWESLIEQDLFCQIVTRGRNSVQTLRLDQLKIEPTDANTITQQMTKTSNWMFGHDKSKTLAENRPAPSEVLEDIAKLRVFSKEIFARRKTAEKDFGDQFKPPICEIG
ncbi:AAA family ATPase [Pseudomonas sp. TH34]|uniref:AAA family ATPase n=1 Tax=Pseudomonas sp. TH34 TaxID=2796399 RepID=UPI0019121AD2|nr:AAA family ATPase [Pseudomonas sp. TH34]MBK5411543.1 AAA family ATPase [Pseudomonas sp. TH34]